MQPNGPRHFVDIAPPPPRPPRPMVPAQPPNVTKIPVNIDPPKQPAVLPQFTPLTQVQPQPMPTVQPQAFVPQPTTPPAEPPKFGALQSKVDAHPLFSGSKEKAPNKPRGFVAKLMWLLAILLVLLAGVYVVIDSGAVNTNINLPFHIFKQTTTITTPVITSGTTSTSAYEDIATKFINAIKGLDKTTADSLETATFKASTKTSAGTTSFYDACQKAGLICTSFFSDNFVSPATKTTKDYKAVDGTNGKKLVYEMTTKTSNSSSINTLTIAVIPYGNDYLVDFADVASDINASTTN